MGQLGRYNNLLIKLDAEGIDVFDYCFDDCELRGLACDDTILISKDIETDAERYCVALEEYGHVKLTVGDITDLKDISNCKQEHKARLMAYEIASEIEDMLVAYNSGARNAFEFAENLGLTESFFIEATMALQGKYGMCFKVKEYTVCFSPFRIYKNIGL